MPSFLITGSSRGLGLAVVKELLHDPENIVIATARNTAESKGLQELLATYRGNNFMIFDLDVTKPDTIQAVALELQGLLPHGLDHLISNAGVSLQSLASFDELSTEKLRAEIDLTVFGPLTLVREFLPLIRKSPAGKIMFVSSQLGSIEIGFHMVNVCNSYGIAKAGLNMLVRKWSAVLKDEGITAFSIHPGWIKETDTGRSITSWVKDNAPGAPSTSEKDSAAGCLKVLSDANMQQAGCFVDFRGEPVPW